MKNFIFGLTLLMFMSFGLNAVEMPDLKTDVLMDQEHSPPETLIVVDQAVVQHEFSYIALPAAVNFAIYKKNAESLKIYYAGFNFGKRTIVNPTNIGFLHFDPGIRIFKNI